MKATGNSLRGFGGVLLFLTAIFLWRRGFPQLEGPEGETWAGVFRIVLPYGLAALIGFGMFLFGTYVVERSGPGQVFVAPQPVEPDHEFGNCVLCDKPVTRNVVVDQYGTPVYNLVGIRCKQCSSVYCEDHKEELQFKAFKGYLGNCPKCGKPLKGNVTFLR